MQPEPLPELDAAPERGSRPLAVVWLDAVWVALVTAYVLVAVMGFDRWFLAAGLAVLFALSVGMLRPVLALLAPDEVAVRHTAGVREAVVVVVSALFPRLPPGPNGGDRG